MDCFNCLIFWIAAPAALFVSRSPMEWLFTGLALSGGACLLERMVKEPVVIQPMPQSAEGEIDNVLRSETFEPRNSPASIGTRSVPQSLSANRQSRPVMATVSPHPRVDPPSRPFEPVPTTSTPQGSLAIRYLETTPIRVQGLGTGRRYEFSPSQSVQSVDVRDASPLLNTRFFRRA